MASISLIPLKLFDKETSIPFVKYRVFAIGSSIAMWIASFILVATMGLNFGIDFRGGTLIELRTQGAADLGTIRSAVGALGLGDAQVQEFGEPTDVLVRIARQTAPNASSVELEQLQQAAVDRVKTALNAALGEVEYRRVEVVGPKVSGELVRGGALAVLLSLAMMMLYIWFRFEWQFGVGAMISTAHDVVITLGVFALFQLEFNLAIIAALLTIVGYSVNDTVVTYDRIRENLRKYKKMPLEELVDKSINATLARTIMTGGSTLVALLGLYIFGGEVIRGFTFAMIFGVVVGTYSSVYIAAPLLLYTGVKRDWANVDGKTLKGAP